MRMVCCIYLGLSPHQSETKDQAWPETEDQAKYNEYIKQIIKHVGACIKCISYIWPDLLFPAGPDLLFQIGAGIALNKYNETMRMVSQSSILKSPESIHVPFVYTYVRLTRYPHTRCQNHTPESYAGINETLHEKRNRAHGFVFRQSLNPARRQSLNLQPRQSLVSHSLTRTHARSRLNRYPRTRCGGIFPPNSCSLLSAHAGIYIFPP